ncbi:hypothetical protein I3760_16G085100 [Carya illinoinensis]|uniref:Uncharacterized protein n=1 Tax=Carya illinoinensis TaxID=32201 RepID=A0A922D501_CARIL|nr:hypothetical protein I3760_16G085100 [Carya illinoinensis]KAG6672839.1 hypothetical protein I3842_16G079300 [Carya illinoinensis]
MSLPRPPVVLPSNGTESQAVVAQHALEVGNQNNRDWVTIIVAFDLSSAIGVALTSVQLHPNFSPTFKLFCFTVSLCFASCFVSHFINSEFPVIARVLYGVGIFFAVTAFFMAITIPFTDDLLLKLTVWLLYAVSFLVIAFSKFFHDMQLGCFWR